MIARTSTALAPGASVDDLPRRAPRARAASTAKDSSSRPTATSPRIAWLKTTARRALPPPTPLPRPPRASSTSTTTTTATNAVRARCSCTCLPRAAGGETFFRAPRVTSTPRTAIPSRLPSSRSARPDPTSRGAPLTIPTPPTPPPRRRRPWSSARRGWRRFARRGRVVREGVTEGVGCLSSTRLPQGGPRGGVLARRGCRSMRRSVARARRRHRRRGGPEVGDDLFQGWRRSLRAESSEAGPSPSRHQLRAEAEGPVGCRNRSRKQSGENNPGNRISEEIRLGRGESRRSGRREGFAGVRRRRGRRVPVGVDRGAGCRRRRVDPQRVGGGERAPPSNVEEDEVNPSEMDASRWRIAAPSGGKRHGATEERGVEGGLAGSLRCCLVDDCTRTRHSPSGTTDSPLTCPEHAGVLTLSYGGRRNGQQ